MLAPDMRDDKWDRLPLYHFARVHLPTGKRTRDVRRFDNRQQFLEALNPPSGVGRSTERCKRVAGVDARPMGRLQAEPGDDAWLIRFITDSRSHKAADIKRAAKVAVIFEVGADDAYVTAIGQAAVKDSATDVRRLWKAAYDGFFPTETDKKNAVFLEIAAERLELWIRGVTPEPFAAQTTVLERRAGGDWRIVPSPS